MAKKTLASLNSADLAGKKVLAQLPMTPESKPHYLPLNI
jgi:polysaccharide deacetylase 2 family uncharacterized protein YibQ